MHHAPNLILATCILVLSATTIYTLFAAQQPPSLPIPVIWILGAQATVALLLALTLTIPHRDN